MRKLLWFTMGFAIVCAVSGMITPGFGVPVTMLMIAGALIARITPGRKGVRPIALMAVGCAVGVAWYTLFSSMYLQIPAALDESVEHISIRTTQYGSETGYGTGVQGILELEGKTYFVQTYLDGEREVEPGDVISGTFRFQYTGREGLGEDTYHRGNGVYLLAYEEESVVISEGERFFLADAAIASRQIGQMLEVFFPKDTVGFAKALLLGDTSGLTYRQDTDLKLSGIRHMVAVSGLHVSILFALISTLALKHRWLKAIIGIPVLICFAAMAGFSPSVNRACIMCAMMLIATLLKRDYDGPTALSFACLVMLLSNPMVIASAAFQLSVSCVAGIYLFQDRIRFKLRGSMGQCAGKGVIPRLKRWFADSVSVSLSAMAFSLPLSALYFGTVSLMGILGNLLTLWVVNLVFCGALGVAVLGMVSNGAALALAAVVSLPIRYILWVAGLLARFPVAAVFTQSVYITVWILLVYALLLAYLLGKERSTVITGSCAVVGLCMALVLSWMEPAVHDVQMTVLDVGHGQSILLQWSGNSFLIDCGGDRDTQAADLAAQTLLSQGTDHLDGLILTHMDYDHAGGAEYLLQRMEADRVILPESPHSDGISGEAVPPMEAVCFEADGGKLTVFGPIWAEGGNENSLCVLFESEKCVILVTGDRGEFGERMLLRYTDLPKVDVLVAGHHGSVGSTGTELLDAVQPDHVMISAGKVDPQLLWRLEEYGCQVWRTDRSGTIIYRR